MSALSAAANAHRAILARARDPPSLRTERQLAPRVHRRALLNLAHVTRLEPLETGGYIARTPRGHSVEVSRQSARELRRMLGLRRGPEEVSGT